MAQLNLYHFITLNDYKNQCRADRYRKVRSRKIETKKQTKIERKHQKIVEANLQMFDLSANISLPQNVTDALARVFDQAADVITGLGSSLGLLTKLRRFITSILNVIFAKEEYKVMSFVMNTIEFLIDCGIGMDIIDTLKNKLEHWWSIVQCFLVAPTTVINTIRANFQADTSDYKIEAIASLVFVLCSALFCAKVPSTDKTHQFIKSLGFLGSSLRGIDSLFAMISKLVNFTISFFKKDIFGDKTQIDTLEQLKSGFRKWTENVEQVVRRDETNISATDRITYDIEFCKRVESLHAEGLRFARDFSDMHLPINLVLPLRTYLNVITELARKVDASGAFGNGPRNEPLVIYLYGASGVGKSGATWPLAIDLLKQSGKLERDPTTWSRYIYYRNVEQEYWDGYDEEKEICIYDDFGQMKDSPGNPNKEFIEVIRTGNIAQFPLHMASLEDKKKAKFVSKVVMISANQTNYNMSSLTHPDAFKRRIDIGVEVLVKDEFKKICVDPSGNTVARLDVEKVEKHFKQAFHPDVYWFVPIDMNTGRPNGEPQNYKQFITRASRMYREKFDRSQTLINYLTEYANMPVYNGEDFGVPPTIQHLNSRYIEEQSEEPQPGPSSAMLINPKKFFSEKFNKGKSTSACLQINNVDAQLSSNQFIYSTDDIPLEHENEWEAFYDSSDDENECEGNMEVHKSKIQFTTPEDLTYFQKLRAQANTFVEFIGLVSACEKGYRLISTKYAAFWAASKSLTALYWTKFTGFFDKIIQAMRAHPLYALGGIMAILASGLSVYWLINRSKKTEKQQTQKRSVSAVRPKESLEIVKEVYCLENNSDLTRQQQFIAAKIGQCVQFYEEFAGRCVEFWQIEHFAREMYNHKPENDERTVEDFKIDLIAILSDYGIRVTEIDEDQVLEGNSSGDPKTLKKRLIRVEGNGSGDPKTMKKKLIRVEGNGSGDPKTLRKKLIKVEANSHLLTHTHEGLNKGEIVKHYHECEICGVDFAHTHEIKSEEESKAKYQHHCKTCKRSQVAINKTVTGENMNADLEVLRDQIGNLVITHKLIPALYRIYGVRSNGDETLLMNGLFIKGRCMLTAAHIEPFLGQFQNIRVRNYCGTQYIVPANSIETTRVVDSSNRVKEAIILQFPTITTQHPDITKHFVTSNELSKFRRAQAVLVQNKNNSKGDVFPYIQGILDIKGLDTITISDPVLGKAIVRKGYEYGGLTIGGDCGSVLVMNEPTVTRKICGIHVAGTTDNRCFSESVTASDLDRAFSEIPASLQISLDIDPLVSYYDVQLPLNCDIDITQFAHFTPGPIFRPGGVVPVAPPSVSKTELQPSGIHNEVFKTTTKPAYLKPVMRDGEMKSPLLIGLKKAAMLTPYIDPTLLNNAANSVLIKLSENTDMCARKVLTDEESVRGVFDDDHIEPINRRTSPGYPWIFQKKGVGKTHWFGDGEWKESPEVMAAMNERIEKAKQGIRVPAVWTDTLKDERRPIEKVEQLKTRVFSNGPMDYTLAFRKYFSAFISHCMKNRIENEIAVGINVYSKEWDRYCKRLTEVGPHVIAGDFSNFDGTLNAMILWKCLEIVNEWYDDGNDLIREVLFSEVVNGIHLCGEHIYFWDHSQPSGNPFTTILNCMYNAVGIRIVWQMAGFQMSDFDTYVRGCYYGDDNIFNISEEVIDKFNQITITDLYAQIGMTYTDEGKTGEIIKSRTLDQVGFLKRGHIYHQDLKRYAAPLSLEVILDMTNWIRSTLEPQEATFLNVETACREFLYHGRDVYDKYVPQLSKACFNRYGCRPNIPTYDELLVENLMTYN